MHQKHFPVDLPASLRARYFHATSSVYKLRYEELPFDFADQAQALLDEGRFDEADSVVRSVPDWQSTYLGWLITGNILHGRQQYADARQAWARARAVDQLVHDQRRSVLLNNDALSLLHEHRIDEAVALCDEAIDLFACWPAPWLTKLSILNTARRIDDIAPVFHQMDHVWPAWRTNRYFDERLDADAHLAGVRARIPPLSR